MALCTVCGTTLEADARFCTKCGTSVQPAPTPAAILAEPSVSSATPGAATGTAVAPKASAPSPEPPVESPATYSFPSSDPTAPKSSLSQYFVVICIGLILLIGAGISAILYLRTQSPATPGSQAPVWTEPASATGDYLYSLNLGNYPGATPVAVVNLNGETVVAGFVTRDKPEQVVQFYKVRFPISEVTAEGATSHLTATLPNGQRIRIDAEPQGANTQVKIVSAK